MSEAVNELQIFSWNEISKIKEIEASLKDTYLGVFYALEWGDLLKIGQSARPYKRMMMHKTNAEKYGKVCLGRICISPAHTNHIENEKKLHSYFAEKRIPETELFRISFDEFILLLRDVDVAYKDESEKIRASSEAFCSGMQKLLFEELSPNKSGGYLDSITPDSPLAEQTAALQRIIEQLAIISMQMEHQTFTARRQWMHIANEKLNLLSVKMGCSHNTLLQQIYQILEEEWGISLLEERLWFMEMQNLPDFFVLMDIFNNGGLKNSFQTIVDSNLAPENRGW